MMDACLQDVLFDGINLTDDICANNPGYDELEIIRTGTGEQCIASLSYMRVHIHWSTMVLCSLPCLRSFQILAALNRSGVAMQCLSV